VQRRQEWNRLRKFARRLGVRLVVIPEDQFSARYDVDIRSLYNPLTHQIIISRKTFADEDIVLFSFAHELGHVMDHMSEPHHSSEYGFHYHLMDVYHRFGRELPESFKRVFQDREDMANDLAENLLEELQIPIGISAREACIHH
jgi:hypothetical protein